MPRFLIIQTAFIGDVVLATALAEKLRQCYPEAVIDFLVRKGNEGLLKDHPFIKTVYTWNKRQRKTINLLQLIRLVRSARYDYIINPHRFASSGFITMLSGAENTVGFDKNPLSFSFTRRVNHVISGPGTTPVHETDRNQKLIEDLTDAKPALPRLYPSRDDYDLIRSYQERPYICVAPTSVWFTKQFPAAKWIALFDQIPQAYQIFLLGGPGDAAITQAIKDASSNRNITDLTGRLSFLQSAALMQGAEMNYVNDSAPLHFASAVNAPVTAVYCSTVPAFGFGPLSKESRVVEIDYDLYCRPCGLHGYKQCPEGHFKCALDIKNDALLWWISKQT
jgi:heptosyltransferase-2